jgi:hypothetical protein
MRGGLTCRIRRGPTEEGAGSCVSHIEEIIQMESPNMIAATLVKGITDDGSRAAVDAENYSGFREPDF